ncbi:MAG: NAD(P)/FAD-dependent oxidoreductase [Candidatus Helarchaeota archaeon]|nr:NAD(P)/FAD-dependent oxidoreductase [Candidatus Helarchaeota archaeon]
MGKRVIVIGSGVAGAGIGALLAYEGYNVKLFDKNRLIGGRFSSERVDGWTLDVGCHLIANCEKGTLGEILRICEEPQDKIKWNYAHNPSPKFFYNGSFVKFPQDVTKFHFPPAALGKLMQLYQDIMNMKPREVEELNYTPITDFVGRYTTDPRVRAMMGYFCGLYFVTDQATSAGEWIYCQQALMKNHSSGYPIGGTIAVPGAYCDIITKHGGEVSTDTPVEKIIIEGNRATGVKLEDGRQIESDLVISNAGIKTTVLKLIGAKYFQKKFVEKVKNYQFSLATLMVKIALDEKITDEHMIMFLSFEEMLKQAKKMNVIPGADAMSDDEFMSHITLDLISKAAQAPELKGYVPPKHFAIFIPIVSNLDPTAAPEGKQLIFAGSGAPDSSQKELNYEKWAESIMAGVRDVFPDIDKHILWTKITSPQDIDSFAGKFGNVIGIGQTVDQVGKNRPPQELPGIENVYECSADTGLHGIGGELAADSALRLYSKLTGKGIKLFLNK